MSEAAGRAVSSAETRLLELQGENRRLRGVLSQLQDDQRDIYYFLQKKLDDNYEVISALEQKIINWQVTQEAAKRRHATELQGLTDSMKAESEQLQTSINEEKEKLFGVKDLAQDKADLEAKIEELNAALREEEAAFLANKVEHERQTVREKEGLKKEIVRKVRETQEAMVEQTSEQLCNKTLMTIRENVDRRSKLMDSSEQVEQLLMRHQRDVDRNLQLRRHLQLVRETTKAVESKIKTYKQRIDERQASSLGQPDDAVGGVQRAADEQPLMTAASEVLGSHASLIDQLTRDLKQSRLESAAVDHGATEATRACTELTAFVDSVVAFLLKCIDDTVEEVGAASGGNDAASQFDITSVPPRLDDMPPVLRLQLLRLLLTKLHDYRVALRALVATQSEAGEPGESRSFLPPISVMPYEAMRTGVSSWDTTSLDTSGRRRWQQHGPQTSATWSWK